MVGIPWRKFYHSKCQWTNIQNLYHVCQFSTSTWSNSILPQAYVKDFVVDVNNATMHIIHETEDGTMADELFDLIGWKSINKLVIGDDSLQNFAFDSDLQQLYYKTRGGMGYRSIIIGDGNSITLSEFKTLPKFAHSFVRAASFSNNFYVIKQETEDGKFEFSIGHSNKNTTMCLLKTKDNIDIQLLVGENENSTYSIVREQISPQFQTTVRPTEEVPKKASSTVFVSLTSMLLVLIISYHM